MAKTKITPFLIDYSASPDPARFKNYEIIILDPANDIDLKNQSHKKTFYGYLSVGEVAESAEYYNRAKNKDIRLLARNPNWNSHVVDLTDCRWREFVVNDLGLLINHKGYDGFFLDTCDSYQLLPKEQWAAQEEGLAKIIIELKSSYNFKKIITNRGFPIFPKIKKSIVGVLIEGLFWHHNSLTNTYEAQIEDGTNWLLGKIAPAQTAKKQIFVVDYVAAGDITKAKEIGAKIEKLRFSPAIYDSLELNGNIVYPR